MKQLLNRKSSMNKPFYRKLSHQGGGKVWNAPNLKAGSEGLQLRAIKYQQSEQYMIEDQYMGQNTMKPTHLNNLMMATGHERLNVIANQSCPKQIKKIQTYQSTHRQSNRGRAFSGRLLPQIPQAAQFAAYYDDPLQRYNTQVRNNPHQMMMQTAKDPSARQLSIEQTFAGPPGAKHDFQSPRCDEDSIVKKTEEDEVKEMGQRAYQESVNNIVTENTRTEGQADAINPLTSSPYFNSNSPGQVLKNQKYSAPDLQQIQMRPISDSSISGIGLPQESSGTFVHAISTNGQQQPVVDTLEMLKINIQRSNMNSRMAKNALLIEGTSANKNSKNTFDPTNHATLLSFMPNSDAAKSKEDLKNYQEGTGRAMMAPEVLVNKDTVIPTDSQDYDEQNEEILTHHRASLGDSKLSRVNDLSKSRSQHKLILVQPGYNHSTEVIPQSKDEELNIGEKGPFVSSFSNPKSSLNNEARRTPVTPKKRNAIKIRGKHLHSPPLAVNKDLEHVTGKNADYAGFYDNMEDKDAAVTQDILSQSKEQVSDSREETPTPGPPVDEGASPAMIQYLKSQTSEEDQTPLTPDLREHHRPQSQAPGTESKEDKMEEQQQTQMQAGEQQQTDPEQQEMDELGHMDLSEVKRDSLPLSRLDVDTANRSIDHTKSNSIDIVDKTTGQQIALVVQERDVIQEESAADLRCLVKIQEANIEENVKLARKSSVNILDIMEHSLSKGPESIQEPIEQRESLEQKSSQKPMDFLYASFEQKGPYKDLDNHNFQKLEATTLQRSSQQSFLVENSSHVQGSRRSIKGEDSLAKRQASAGLYSNTSPFVEKVSNGHQVDVSTSQFADQLQNFPVAMMQQQYLHSELVSQQMAMAQQQQSKQKMQNRFRGGKLTLVTSNSNHPKQSHRRQISTQRNGKNRDSYAAKRAQRPSTGAPCSKSRFVAAHRAMDQNTHSKILKSRVQGLKNVQRELAEQRAFFTENSESDVNRELFFSLQSLDKRPSQNLDWQNQSKYLPIRVNQQSNLSLEKSPQRIKHNFMKSGSEMNLKNDFYSSEGAASENAQKKLSYENPYQEKTTGIINKQQTKTDSTRYPSAQRSSFALNGTNLPVTQSDEINFAGIKKGITNSNLVSQQTSSKPLSSSINDIIQHANSNNYAGPDAQYGNIRIIQRGDHQLSQEQLQNPNYTFASPSSSIQNMFTQFGQFVNQDSRMGTTNNIRTGDSFEQLPTRWEIQEMKEISETVSNAASKNLSPMNAVGMDLLGKRKGESRANSHDEFSTLKRVANLKRQNPSFLYSAALSPASHDAASTNAKKALHEQYTQIEQVPEVPQERQETLQSQDIVILNAPIASQRWSVAPQQPKITVNDYANQAQTVLTKTCSLGKLPTSNQASLQPSQPSIGSMGIERTQRLTSKLDVIRDSKPSIEKNSSQMQVRINAKNSIDQYNQKQDHKRAETVKNVRPSVREHSTQSLRATTSMAIKQIQFKGHFGPNDQVQRKKERDRLVKQYLTHQMQQDQKKSSISASSKYNPQLSTNPQNCGFIQTHNGGYLNMQIYRPELPEDKFGAKQLVEAAINSKMNIANQSSMMMEPKILQKSKSYQKSQREKNSHQLIHYLPSTKTILNQMGINYKTSIRTNSLGDISKRQNSNHENRLKLIDRIDQMDMLRHTQSFSNLPPGSLSMPGRFIATRNNEEGSGFTDQEVYRSEMRQRIKSAGFLHINMQQHEDTMYVNQEQEHVYQTSDLRDVKGHAADRDLYDANLRGDISNMKQYTATVLDSDSQNQTKRRSILSRDRSKRQNTEKDQDGKDVVKIVGHPRAHHLGRNAMRIKSQLSNQSGHMRSNSRTRSNISPQQLSFHAEPLVVGQLVAQNHSRMLGSQIQTMKRIDIPNQEAYQDYNSPQDGASQISKHKKNRHKGKKTMVEQMLHTGQESPQTQKILPDSPNYTQSPGQDINSPDCVMSPIHEKNRNIHQRTSTLKQEEEESARRVSNDINCSMQISISQSAQKQERLHTKEDQLQEVVMIDGGNLGQQSKSLGGGDSFSAVSQLHNNLADQNQQPSDGHAVLIVTTNAFNPAQYQHTDGDSYQMNQDLKSTVLSTNSAKNKPRTAPGYDYANDHLQELMLRGQGYRPPQNRPNLQYTPHFNASLESYRQGAAPKMRTSKSTTKNVRK